jgi:LysM repeat protein
MSSGPYDRAFASPNVFKKLLRSVEQEMARRNGRRRAHIRKLALSSWSAGYGAIAQILRQKAGRKVDALILLDSVYAGYAGASKRLKPATLVPFVRFARLAARGQKFMFHSHSSIQPPGYASTREVSHYIVKKVGGRIRPSRRADRYGLQLFERYDKRHYHVRGYRGEDKPDHCAHLGLMRDVLRVHLNRRWRSPRARAGSRKVVSKARQRALRNGQLHVVKKGEHLTGIARHYKTSVTGIRKLNRLRKAQPLRIGQELLVPEAIRGAGGQKSGGRSHAKKKRQLLPGHRIHIVADGQTLGSIGQRYHVTVATLRTANDLKRRQPIRPGQQLIVPPPPPKRKRRR